MIQFEGVVVECWLSMQRHLWVLLAVGWLPMPMWVQVDGAPHSRATLCHAF